MICSGPSDMQLRRMTPSAERDTHQAATSSPRCRSQQTGSAGLACASGRSALTAETAPQKSSPCSAVDCKCPSSSLLARAARLSPPLSHVTSSMADMGAPLHGRILHGCQRHVAHRKVTGADHEGVDACASGAVLSSAGRRSHALPRALAHYSHAMIEGPMPIAPGRHATPTTSLDVPIHSGT